MKMRLVLLTFFFSGVSLLHGAEIDLTLLESGLQSEVTAHSNINVICCCIPSPRPGVTEEIYARDLMHFYPLTVCCIMSPIICFGTCITCCEEFDSCLRNNNYSLQDINSLNINSLMRRVLRRSRYEN